jgi:AraC-like DNA-binding protein
MIAVDNKDAVSVDRVTTLGGADLVEARFVTMATPPHSHPDVEIGVVAAGQRLVRCRGRAYRAPTGAVVIFNPGEIHAGAPLDAVGSSYRAFLISAATLATTCDWWAEPGDTALPWFENPVVIDPVLAEELVDAHISIATHGADLRTDTQLAEALAGLVRRHRRPAPAQEPADHTRQAVLRVQSYLDDNYRAKVRLGALAEIAGLSVFHLIRVFRAATGLPPYAYLEQVRIHRAAALLREGHPVSRVAALTGFADQSHLTRFFKRLIGVPPGRYQRSAMMAPSGDRILV